MAALRSVVGKRPCSIIVLDGGDIEVLMVSVEVWFCLNNFNLPFNIL